VSGWEEIERPAPDEVAGLRVGSRVRLHPRTRGGDIFDLVLAERTAVIEAIEQDLEGEVRFVVVAEDDPGRDLGFARRPGHRFFFSPAEVEPLEPSPAPVSMPPPRVLVAGIGNVFMGDDGFGVALADRLSRREVPDGVDVVDYGIRGMDLAFAMQDGYDAVVLLDATPRGEPAGTLYVIEAETGAEEPAVGAHGMNPVQVLALVRAFGGSAPRTFVVGCQPLTQMTGEEEEIVASLSAPVRAALDPAVTLVQSLLADICDPTRQQEVSPR
jgi:hydrogenase maturation protease